MKIEDVRKLKATVYILSVAVITLVISLVSVAIRADRLDAEKRVLMQMIQIL
jgi:hypothetical protein